MNIGPYRIIRKLGEGGMSNVFLTEDVRTGRVVALKLLAPRVVADETYRLRLLREAHAVATLQHPNITALYEADQFQDQPYLAIEYVEGESVSDLLVSGPFPVVQAAWIAAEVANALAAAHAAGIVHRDVKPSNIFVQTGGGVKVMDFGLAKFEEDDGESDDEDDTGQMRNLTARGTILGTVNYMCPEQAHGDSVDFRADIFSLGVLLYEMLSGRAPFRGAHTFAVLRSIIEAAPEPVSLHRPDVPPELEAVVRRAMAKRPEDRYQSASDMESALRDVLRAVMQTGPIL
jgi:eukaryotic-like serine/threonine-protein kinase